MLGSILPYPCNVLNCSCSNTQHHSPRSSKSMLHTAGSISVSVAAPCDSWKWSTEGNGQVPGSWLAQLVPGCLQKALLGVWSALLLPACLIPHFGEVRHELQAVQLSSGLHSYPMSPYTLSPARPHLLGVKRLVSRPFVYLHPSVAPLRHCWL